MEYEKIYSETIKEQKVIMKRFENNMKKRNELKKDNEPCDPLDPLYSNVIENSNGWNILYILQFKTFLGWCTYIHVTCTNIY